MKQIFDYIKTRGKNKKPQVTVNKGFLAQSVSKLAALFAAVILLLTSNVGMAGDHHIKVPNSLLEAHAKKLLSNAEINIHTFGAFNSKTKTWFNNKSYIRIGGKKRTLAMKDLPGKKIGRRYFRPYFENWKSKQFTVRMEGQNLMVVKFAFEEKGNEVRLGCHKLKWPNKGKPCKWHVFDHKLQIKNANVIAKIRFGLNSNGNIFCNVVNVTAGMQVVPDSWVLRNLKKIIDKHVKNTDAYFIRKMEKVLAEELGKICKGLVQQLNREIDGRLADKLRAVLGNKADAYVKNNSKVKSLKSKGKHLVARVSYKDLITKYTLKIKEFRVNKPNQTMSCPGDVSFKATVYTKAKIKNGTGYVKVTGGPKGKKFIKKFTWSNAKNKTNTSTITIKYKTKDTKKRTLFARLVLSYTGSSGKKITKKSPKVKFTRTCKIAGNLKS